MEVGQVSEMGEVTANEHGAWVAISVGIGVGIGTAIGVAAQKRE